MSGKIKSFLKDSMFYGIVTGISAMLGFFLLPFYTRIFSPDEFGIMDLISTSISLVNIFVLLNLNSAVLRYYYEFKRPEERSIMISTVLLIIMAAGTVAVTLCIVFAGNISNLLFRTDVYKDSLKIAAVIILLSAVFQYLIIILRIKRWKREFGIAQIGLFICSASLIIALAVVADDKVKAVFIAQMFSHLVFTIYLLWICRGYLRVTFSMPLLYRASKYSLPMLPSVVASWATNSINRYFILSYIGSFGVGVFVVGTKLSMGIMILVEAFRLGWGPFAMSLIGDKDQKKIYKKILTYYLAFMLAVSSVIAVFSRDIIELVTIEEYFSSFEVVGLITGSLVLYGAFSITAISGLMTEKTYYNSIATTLGLAANIALMVLLLPTIGIIGAAIAAFVGSCTVNIVMLIFTYKYYPIAFELGKVTIMLVGYIMITIYSALETGHSIPLKLLILSVYFLFLYGLLDTETKAEVKNIYLRYVKVDNR